MSTVSSLISSMIAALPDNYRSLATVVGLAMVIVLYALFVWKFYTFVARKDIIKLNLSRYNQSEHPFFGKLWAVLFYFVEYIVILPFLIFFWFSVFALIIFLMLEKTSVIATLNLAAAVVASIRILAYHKSNLAEEVAKLFPLTVLIVFVTRADITPLTRISETLVQVPQFLGAITFYFVFIAGLELLLRALDLVLDYQED